MLEQSSAEVVPPLKRKKLPYTGTAVFRGGLKNGSFVTTAAAFWRTASMVTSMSSFMPGFECAVSTLARAISFLSTGDQVVEVALPTWRLPE